MTKTLEFQVKESVYNITMVDSEFAFEPPSDEEIDYEDVNSGADDEDDNSDVEEKGKTHKKTQSPWDFSSYTESVAEEHARRSTTSIDDKISKIIQQRGHADLIQEKDEVDEDGSTDSEPDRQVSTIIYLYIKSYKRS